ncbi:MAG: hypothetical protein HRT52_08875 [Colwellia sp.]|nr:hypothetical protein [Colwellia sp.]
MKLATNLFLLITLFTICKSNAEVLSTQVSSDEITLDGKINEPIWSKAQKFSSFVVTSPDTGLSPKVNTVVRVMTTRDGLYIAFENQQDRDKRSRKYSGKDQHTSADFNVVAIDFSGQGDTVYEFVTTLGNGSMDGVYSRGNNFDDDWEGAWDFSISEDEVNWYSEIFIPWTIAPFPITQKNNLGEIKLHFSRYNIAEGESYSFPDTSSSRANFMQSLHSVKVDKPENSTMQVFPYSSITQDFNEQKSTLRVGTDLLWKPTVDQQITATINPDFGQAESDELIANFSAIETLYSDKRAFFTENQSLFDVKGNDFEMLNTRRIGGNTDGLSSAPSDILAAVKYINTNQHIDFGIMAVTEDDSSDAKGKQFLSTRWLYKGEQGYVGQLINWVNRPTINRHAISSAIDYGYNKDRLTIDGKFLYSNIKQQDNADSLGDGLGGTFNVNYRASRQWQTDIKLTWLDNKLALNDMGYLARNNLKKMKLSSDYLLLPNGDNNFFRQINFHGSALLASNFQNEHLPQKYTAAITLKTQNSAKYITTVKYTTSGIDDLISRNNGSIKLAERQDYLLQYVSPYVGDFHYEVDLNSLQEGIAGWANSVKLSADYAFSDQTIFSASVSHLNSDDWLIGDSDGKLTSYQRNFDQLSFKVLWSMFENQELSLKGQWYSIEAKNGKNVDFTNDQIPSSSLTEQQPNFKQSQLTLQLRYRYRFAPLSDVFLVYARNGMFFEQGQQFTHHNEVIRNQFENPDVDLLMFKIRFMY